MSILWRNIHSYFFGESMTVAYRISIMFHNRFVRFRTLRCLRAIKHQQKANTIVNCKTVALFGNWKIFYATFWWKIFARLPRSIFRRKLNAKLSLSSKDEHTQLCCCKQPSEIKYPLLIQSRLAYCFWANRGVRTFSLCTRHQILCFMGMRIIFE